MNGIELINAERKEQIEKHGFSLTKDQYYQNRELWQAACYCLQLAGLFLFAGQVISKWPETWDKASENKIIAKDDIGRLKVAGAFLKAETERLGRPDYYDYEIQQIASRIDNLQK